MPGSATSGIRVWGLGFSILGFGFHGGPNVEPSTVIRFASFEHGHATSENTNWSSIRYKNMCDDPHIKAECCSLLVVGFTQS